MKKTLLISFILLQACGTVQPTVNPVAEQLVEPPGIRVSNKAAGASIERGQNMRNQLQGDQWQLLSYFTEQGMQVVLPDTLVSIEFAEYRISGSTGCNRYFASYQLLAENTVKISQPGLTMMACPEKIAAQQHQYLKNLADIHFYQFQEDRLQLLDAQQQVRLIFQNVPALALEQTIWQVTGINNGTGGVVSSAHTEKAQMQFIDGKLQGTSGCNTFNASYQIEGSDLTIGPVGITRMLCAEKDLMVQEQQLLQALKKIKRYEIGNNQLRLVNAKGSLMVGLKQQ
ncbi:MAG: hypothetical protein DRQ62_12765 [Gammaproteobacteria bacterium]|nr:MAG: hypothetical protein DRQ62_12765 [Gammaproteobacteria bacterium]